VLGGVQIRRDSNGRLSNNAAPDRFRRFVNDSIARLATGDVGVTTGLKGNTHIQFADMNSTNRQCRGMR
jgi:hypothetical protein